MAPSLFDQLRIPRLMVLLIAAFLALLPGPALAQQPATLTGRVTAESGQPLGSAGVIIEQLSAGAVTRPDGSYTIIIPGALLRVFVISCFRVFVFSWQLLGQVSA